MKSFVCRHEIDCSPEQFWKVIHFGLFNKVMYDELLGFGYEVIEDNHDTGKRRTRITPVVDAPKALLKAFGGVPSFEEVGQHHPEPKRYEFHIVPPGKFAKKIDIHGVMKILPNGDDKCWRTVEFNIGCTIFGVGGLFEHFVSKEIQKSYVQSCEFTNKYLHREGLTGRPKEKAPNPSVAVQPR